MQGRRIIDAIAHITNHVPGLLQREDDAFLLVGVHFREETGACGQVNDDLLHIRLGWIEEEQETSEGEFFFIGG